MSASLTHHLERVAGSDGIDPAAMSLPEARRIARAYFVDANGYASAPRLLTYPEAQRKLGKSERATLGLTLAPADASGWNVCLWSTASCRAACVLNTAGNARYATVRDARVVRTRFLAEYPQAFVTLATAELIRAVERYGGEIDYRPNVASDVRWERIVPAWFGLRGVRVYDYTKAPRAHRTPTRNYRLVYSVSERPTSTDEALAYLQSGGTTAVVFATRRGAVLPTTWNGFPVIDADADDARTDDPSGVVVGLRAKGAAIGTVGTVDGFVKPNTAS